MNQAKDFRISIEGEIPYAIEAVGADEVIAVLGRYGDGSVDGINDCELPDAFAEIFNLTVCMG